MDAAMPTYEYRCNGCQREFEIQQKMADPDLVHCDACGQDKLEKLISWTSVRSNSYQEALLHSSNPRDAFKSNSAVDRSRPPKKETPEPVAVAPEPAATTDTPAPTSSPTDKVDEDDEDDDAPAT
jgi:putative FmdB family regulatory protein